MSFGEKLSTLRLEKQITQETLSEKLDVSVQTVHRWEHDKSAPNVHQLKALCEILDVKSEYFFAEEKSDEKLEETPTAIMAEAIATTAEKKNKGLSMLFANKWYYWICLVPWFIMFAQSLQGGPVLLFTIGSCIVWSLFTLSQELLFHFQTSKGEGLQILLNVVKTILITSFAICLACIDAQLFWKIFFIFVGCMCVVICAWEIVLIKKEYKNRKN